MTIELILSLIGGLATIVQSIRARNYRAAADTMIESIETIHDLQPNGVKSTVDRVSRAQGTASTIAKRVNAITKKRK